MENCSCPDGGGRSFVDGRDRWDSIPVNCRGPAAVKLLDTMFGKNAVHFGGKDRRWRPLYCLRKL